MAAKQTPSLLGLRQIGPDLFSGLPCQAAAAACIIMHACMRMGRGMAVAHAHGKHDEAACMHAALTSAAAAVTLACVRSVHAP